MCGIVGGVSERNVVPVMLEGLSRLEYRGYDSVGVAVVDSNAVLARERVTGRVRELSKLCSTNSFKGLIGIGHTRWATHGGVSTENAHPHFSNDTVAVVHNGIIENHTALKEKLIASGYVFKSETDTEVIVHLIHSYYVCHHDLLLAVKQSIKELRGAYAIGVIAKDKPGEVICARLGSPLVLGEGINEMFFASDLSALLPVTQKVIYLEDGDVVRFGLSDWTIFDKDDIEVERQINLSELSITHTELGKYRHYMQKEIFEQPKAVLETLQNLGNKFNPDIFGAGASAVFATIERVQIIACGTSYNAGLVAKYWIEELTGLECAVEIASEYRYRRVSVNDKTLVVSISQSGETADTLACIKYVHELGMSNTLSICNVAESSLVRLSKFHVLTQAGMEIGVASTKAFTTQLVVLLYLAATIARTQNKLSLEVEHTLLAQIMHLPKLMLEVLELEPHLKELASKLEHRDHTLFLGRNTMYPIAMEGALKLKEISYIHAESYAAGELKHGPLALIDNKMPSIVLMPSTLLVDKVKSNIEEILAREGVVYLFTDSKDDISAKCHKTIMMPAIDASNYLLPILYTIPLQLLAYYTALAKGTDVDKPRNLAKSVTVE